MQHGTPAAPPPPPGGFPLWQYLSIEAAKVDAQLTLRLNQLGAEGWELVAMESMRHPGVRGTTMSYALVFKRRFA